MWNTKEYTGVSCDPAAENFIKEARKRNKKEDCSITILQSVVNIMQ